MKLSLPLLALSLAVPAFGAEQKKTRDEMVHDDRSAFSSNEAWIYNDLEKATATAKAEGKPLFIVLRCIP